MGVKIELNPFFFEATGGEDSFEAEGNTVEDCLKGLTERFPALREKLFTKKGELQSYIEIYVNGVSTHPQGLTYPVKDGDEIAVTVLAAGG